MINYRLKSTATLEIILLCAVFFPSFSLAQTVYQIHYLGNQVSLKHKNYYYHDSISCQNQIQEVRQKDYRNGYLLAGIDSILHSGDTIHYFYNHNRKLSGVYISDVQNSVKTTDSKQSFKPDEWVKFSTDLITKDLSTGFPLSKVKLVPDTIMNDTLFASLDYKQGPYFYFGEIDQRNGIVVNNRYLMELLHFKTGQPFNQKIITRSRAILSRLPYLESQYIPRVNFFGEKADMYLYLKKKPANNFDLLLGFNNKNSGASKTVQITGQANIDLYNSFKLGDRLYLHYENLQESSPRLNFFLDLPYIRLPFGLTTRFDLIKNKDEYINFQTQLKLNKTIQQQEELSIVLFNNSSYLLQVDTVYVKAQQLLPKSLDFSLLSYGLAYKLNSTNDNFNPTQGLLLELQALVGTKKFKKNPGILKFDSNGKLNTQYDSLNKNGVQSNVQSNITGYISLSKRQVLKGSTQGFLLISKNQSLENELIKIGGIHTLRGFNDNQFTSDAYVLSTAEYRFLLDRNSFLSLFVDHAWMRLISQNNIIPWQNYLGIGAGMQFRTKAGAFGLYFAVGRSETVDFDFSSPKVHFGYTAIF